MTPAFFTSDDLKQLQALAGTTFDKDDPAHRQQERELVAGVWAKTAYWLRQLAHRTQPRFDAHLRQNVRQQAGTHRTADGGRAMHLRFKPFTWGKIYPKGTEEYRIFFTVGIDATHPASGPCLVWRLGCQTTGGEALTEPQQRRFAEFMDGEGAELKWHPVYVKQLGRWDWDRLLDETEAFITSPRHLDLFEQAVAYVWGEKPTYERKLARLCWNTLGWARPSGREGKSRTPGTFEAEHGFGEEEWLFDFDRLIDGFHYAFLQPLNRTARHQGAIYSIRLYTLDGTTGRYYYAGRIRRAEVLTPDQIQHAYRAYEARIKGSRRGASTWQEQMRAELDALGLDPEALLTETIFNLRFRPEDVERPETPGGLLLIKDFSTWTGNTHYVLLDDQAPALAVPPRGRRTAGARRLVMGTSERKGTTGTHRETEARSVELRQQHMDLQRHLVEDLQRQFRGQLISKEAIIEPYQVSVDVVRELPDGGYVFYEIKALPTLKECIREALGQLLEYACWPDGQLATEWVIVAAHAPTQEATAYLANIAKRFKLPVRYQQGRQ